jgi:hypothetical protein
MARAGACVSMAIVAAYNAAAGTALAKIVDETTEVLSGSLERR